MNMTPKVDRPNEAAAILGISKSTLDRWSKQNPDFPQKIKIGRRAVGYDHNEIVDYINNQKAKGLV